MSFYNLFVTIRSVDQQVNSLPKTLTSRSNRIRWGMLPDYLRSDTKDLNQRQKNPLSLTAVIICLATVNSQKIIDRRKFGKAHAGERRIPQHWEEPCYTSSYHNATQRLAVTKVFLSIPLPARLDSPAHSAGYLSSPCRRAIHFFQFSIAFFCGSQSLSWLFPVARHWLV